jgi:hypothetical protein
LILPWWAKNSTETWWENGTTIQNCNLDAKCEAETRHLWQKYQFCQKALICLLN